MSFYRQPRRVILLGLVLSVFSFAVAMDEAKVSSLITNSNKELIFIFFLFTGLFVPYRLYYALNGFNVYTLGGVYSCTPDGQNKDLDFRLIDLRSCL